MYSPVVAHRSRFLLLLIELLQLKLDHEEDFVSILSLLNYVSVKLMKSKFVRCP